MTKDTTGQGATGAGAESRTLRIAVIGSCLALWTLAPYMVVSVNGLRAEVAALRGAVDRGSQQLSSSALEGYELADQSGAVVYSFKRGAEASHDASCGGSCTRCEMLKQGPPAPGDTGRAFRATGGGADGGSGAAAGSEPAAE